MKKVRRNGRSRARAASSASDPWFVYILWSASALVFYTGASNNPDRRLLKHNGALPGGARFTRPRRPWRIVYVEGSMTKHDALRRERAIKKLSRQDKFALIVNGVWNPSLSRFERQRAAKTPVCS